MVSLRATTRKYRGKMAANYETKRRPQIRWRLENEIVERMLSDLRPGTAVLDCPVGTGRFLPLYARMKFTYLGVDASEQMLALAATKRPAGSRHLRVGDATRLEVQDSQFDCAVCVRFLDLIDEEAMRRVLGELTRVTRSRIVLTIRLGPSYVPKSNTATHDEGKFRALVNRRGWRVAEEVPIFGAGWRVVCLKRK